MTRSKLSQTISRLDYDSGFQISRFGPVVTSDYRPPYKRTSASSDACVREADFGT
jgi:hypothetical protein